VEVGQVTPQHEVDAEPRIAKGIADKFTKGQFEAYRLMYVDQMTELLSGEPPPISPTQSQTQSALLG
jgi:hypothetical protein